MKLYGKKWDGEWEPAAASWFKTPLGWRLAYGEPLPDVPMGGLTPDWTELHVTLVSESSDNYCTDGQTDGGSNQFKCRYTSYQDKSMCQASFNVTDALGNVVGSYRTTNSIEQESLPLVIPCSGVSWETIGNFRMTSGWGPHMYGWSWESFGVDGTWLQRGNFRDAECYAPSFFQLTEQNPALDGTTKTIDYIEYSWDCPMTKELKHAPYREDQKR